MGKNRFLPSGFEAITRCNVPLPGVPLVEVCNNRRILIENHQGVVAYESNEIIVKVRDGTICICGSRLRLMRMSRYQLVIMGLISSVHFGDIC